jgi:ribosomal protein S18 acetylase RimI-like enzyme
LAEQDLVQRGFTWAVLNVSRENLDARRLYERSGYRVVAGDPGRWTYLDDHGIRHDVNEPAWRMEKKLIP